MERLGQRDFEVILDFLKEIYAPVVLSEFPDRLVDNLRQLIPCELATYDEMDPDRHISVDQGSPADMMTPELKNQCWHLVMHEHPVLMHTLQTGDLRAGRISDFYSEPEFRRRAVYQEFYRKMSIQDVLCKAIRVSGRVVIGSSVSRARRSFTGKDSLVLDLVGPHLAQAWRNARAMSRLHRQSEAASTALEALHCGSVPIRPDGRAMLMTPWARNILEEFFGPGSVGDHRLPDTLNRWIRDRKKQFTPNQVPRPLDPLVVSRGDSELVVRLLPGSPQDLLVLEARRPVADRARLESHGLTRREAEVLTWVAKAKTNQEIAGIIGISPRTVQKHLERIFPKLGVETRTSAAAFALRIMQH